MADCLKLLSVFSERSGHSVSYGHRTAHPLRVLLFAVFSFQFSAFCFAEELTDPTRPPASIAAPAAEAVVPAAGLQSVIIGKSRRAAIINGQTVELGGRVDGAKLAEVYATHVVLRGSGGRQVLRLFGDVSVTRDGTAETKVRGHKKVSGGDK